MHYVIIQNDDAISTELYVPGTLRPLIYTYRQDAWDYILATLVPGDVLLRIKIENGREQVLSSIPCVE